MAAPPLDKGSSINEYVILAKLGEGGCGVVYKAKHAYNIDAPPVAIKLMHDMADVDRFTRERLIMQRADHQNVVKMVEFGSYREHPYIVMEFVNGGSIDRVLHGRRKETKTTVMPAVSGQAGSAGQQTSQALTPVFTPSEASWILIQAIDGLRAAGVVHRDLKPENLMLHLLPGQKAPVFIPGDYERSTVVKVADFGLAKSWTPGTDKSLTVTGVVMGTPAYMSPEQCRNTKTVTSQSDMYALGIILFELISGNPPFWAGSPVELMTMHIDTDVTYPPGFPEDIKAICSKCLAKDPEQRYRTLSGLQSDLRKVCGSADPEPSETAGAEQEKKGFFSKMNWFRRKNP